MILLYIAVTLGLAIFILYLIPGYTSSIKDSNGRSLKGSIASLEKVNLGGQEQWILLRGEKATNPIILFLHGGPGTSDMGLLRRYMSELEKHFIASYDSYNNGYNNTLGGLSTEGCRKEEQYIIRFPDGSIHLVTGWNKFIRDNNLNAGNLWRTLNPVKRTYEINGRFYTYYQKNHHCKGYTLLGKFNDYPDREYIRMDGSVELLRNEDEDIVCSNMKVLAGENREGCNEPL